METLKRKATMVLEIVMTMMKTTTTTTMVKTLKVKMKRNKT
jgi:hypothetical protein